jgi:hypothetical protein
MKYLFYLIVVILFIPDLVLGQSMVNKGYLDFLVSKNRDKDYFQNFRGSPFENSDFTDARIYTLGHSSPQIKKLRYNNCFDEMEMMVDGKEEIQFLDNKPSVDSIVLNNELYKYLSYNDKGKKNSGYFIQLYSGNCKLFTKRPREFTAEKRPTSGYEEYVPPTITKLPELFYVQFGYGPLELLPKTSKKIVAFLQEKGFDMAGAFPKKQKISNDKESLIKVAAWCSQYGKSVDAK